MRDYLAIGSDKYLCGKGVLTWIGAIAKDYGSKAFIMGGARASKAVSSVVEASLGENNVAYQWEIFKGYCSEERVRDFSGYAKAAGADLIVGVGGGRALDTAKAVAHHLRLPIITVPTIAATCAAWTPLSIMYTEDGHPGKSLETREGPRAVICDMDVITNAPMRYLVAGIGDSMAKWPETTFGTLRAVQTVNVKATLALAQLSYSIAMEFGPKAVEDKNLFDITMIVDNNILLTGIISGIIGDVARLAIAHAIDKGLIIADYSTSSGNLHGERVCYGTLIQLAILNAEKEQLIKLARFSKRLGLPTRLSDFGYDSSDDFIRRVSAATVSDQLIKDAPIEITPDMIEKAIHRIEALAAEL